MVADAQPVRIELAGRPALEGTVVVDGPLTPHLWGITGDLVVTVSGDLSRDELQQVAASLRPHTAR
jgi:anti-sigma factor RsiW